MTTRSLPTLGIGMVGYAFMGAAHSQAWRTAGRVFDLPLSPLMVALCGRDAEAAGRAAATLGWQSAVSDWKELVERPDMAVMSSIVLMLFCVVFVIAGIRAVRNQVYLESLVAGSDYWPDPGTQKVPGGRLAPAPALNHGDFS